MGQIVSSAAKPKRCNANQLSQVPTPAAGEYILVSSDNSMNAAGQGNFDCYIVGEGNKAATALELRSIADSIPTENSKNSVTSGGVYAELSPIKESYSNIVINVPPSKTIEGATLAASGRVLSASGHTVLAFTGNDGDVLTYSCNVSSAETSTAALLVKYSSINDVYLSNSAPQEILLTRSSAHGTTISGELTIENGCCYAVSWRPSDEVWTFTKNQLKLNIETDVEQLQANVAEIQSTLDSIQEDVTILVPSSKTIENATLATSGKVTSATGHSVLVFTGNNGDILTYSCNVSSSETTYVALVAKYASVNDVYLSNSAPEQILIYRSAVYGTTINGTWTIENDCCYAVSWRPSDETWTVTKESSQLVVQTQMDALQNTVDELQQSISAPAYHDALSYDNTNVTIEDGEFCPITRKFGKKIRGTGAQTIIFSYDNLNGYIGFAVKCPPEYMNSITYVSLQGRNGTFNALGTINISRVANSSTPSGYSYGFNKEWLRCTFDATTTSLDNVKLTINAASDVSWELNFSYGCVINDVLPIKPILFIYDSYRWHGTFDYEDAQGVMHNNITIWKLHQLLNIPFAIAMSSSGIATQEINADAQECLNDGLAELMVHTGAIGSSYSSGGAALTQAFIDELSNVDTNTKGCVCVGNGVDNTIVHSMIMAGVDFYRNIQTYSMKGASPCNLPDDGNILSIPACSVATNDPTQYQNTLPMPLILWEHGIGYVEPSDPYAGYYADSDGSKSIACLEYIKEQTEAGKLIPLLPSEFVPYIRKIHQKG